MPDAIAAFDRQLLARAVARSRDGEPTFRFHGHNAPTNRERTPVAYEPSTKVRDGVAKLRLYEPIDSWGGPWGVSAAEFVDALDALEGDVSEIRLHINSPGGEVWEGLAIMNALAQHDARVVAVVDGLAASAASFIAVSADEVIMGRNTQLMIHDALGICIGQSTDMHDFGDFLGKISDNIASIYAAKAGGAVADWRKAMLAESWYTGQEAVDAGLADSLAEPPAQTGDADPTDKWDLSIYTHAGRDAAPAPVVPTASAPETTDEAEAERADRLGRLMARRHAMNARKG